MVQRMGRVIGIKPEGIDRYKELHVNLWPSTVELLKKRNIQNFSIFLREPENLLFSYWEYTGDDFQRDFERGTDNEQTREWWDLISPLQEPLDTRAKGEWWAQMESVFFLE